jgi:hypothetical protein
MKTCEQLEIQNKYVPPTQVYLPISKLVLPERSTLRELSGSLSSSPLCVRTYTLTHSFLLSQLPAETLKRRTNTLRPEAIKMLNLIGKRAGWERTFAKKRKRTALVARERGATKNSVTVAETAARQLISNFIEFVSPSCVCVRQHIFK